MGGTEVNGLMVFNSSGYTVLVHVNIAHIYYYKSLFLHTEEAISHMDSLLSTCIKKVGSLDSFCEISFMDKEFFPCANYYTRK